MARKTRTRNKAHKKTRHSFKAVFLLLLLMTGSFIWGITQLNPDISEMPETHALKPGQYEYYRVLETLPDNAADTFAARAQALFREKSDEVKKIVTGTGHEKTATDKAKVTAQRVRPVTEKERPMVVRSQPVNNARAADAMRAKLLLSGFEARSYRYRDSNGLMRYRVEVGPFSQKDAAETARAQLARYGTAGQIEPL